MVKEIVSPVATPLHRRPWLGPRDLAYSDLPYVWESIPRGKDSVENRRLFICAEAGTKGCAHSPAVFLECAGQTFSPEYSRVLPAESLISERSS